MYKKSFLNILFNSINLYCEEYKNSIFLYSNININREQKLLTILNKDTITQLNIKTININDIHIEINIDKKIIWIKKDFFNNNNISKDTLDKWIKSTETYNEYNIIPIVDWDRKIIFNKYTWNI